jgi:hypothetical protein
MYWCRLQIKWDYKKLSVPSHWTKILQIFDIAHMHVSFPAYLIPTDSKLILLIIKWD